LNQRKAKKAKPSRLIPRKLAASLELSNIKSSKLLQYYRISTALPKQEQPCVL